MLSKATIGTFSEETVTCAPSQGHKRHSKDGVRAWGPGLSQVSATCSQKALSNRSCLQEQLKHHRLQAAIPSVAKSLGMAPVLRLCFESLLDQRATDSAFKPWLASKGWAMKSLS